MTVAPPNVLRLKVLDVGEGDAIVMFLPNCRRAFVVDAFDGQKVVDALESEGVDEVVLFLSHSDRDHVMGVCELLDKFPGGFIAFFYNRDRLNATLTSEYRAVLQALAKATRATASSYSADFNTNLNSDRRFAGLVHAPVSIEVLHPTHSEQSSLVGTSTNEPAGVLRVVYTDIEGRSWAVLLAADVQLTGISCMMHRLSNTPTKLQANILKFPHHGAWPTDYPGISQFPGMPRREMADFLDAVDPQFALLSVAYGNQHGHVYAEVFAALRDLANRSKRLRRILCTQFTDTCLRPGTTCTRPNCASDIEIGIGGASYGGIEVLPQHSVHQAHILAETDLAHAGCGLLLSERALAV
jgi:beta-lactamase superfamily II metal-dependent hydrolase